MKKAFILSFFVFGSLICDCFDELVEVFDRYGGDSYMAGEAVTQKNHVLQAANLAEKAGAPEVVVIGLLFHDIGRVIEDDLIGNESILHEVHDDLGADWLKRHNFPSEVVDLIRYHTLAKLVLCDEKPGYYHHLSLPSQESYHIQKEKYLQNGETLDYFNSLSYRSWIVSARKCDDMAKDPHLDWERGDIPDFDHYREMIERVRAGKGQKARNQDWQLAIDSWHSTL